MSERLARLSVIMMIAAMMASIIAESVFTHPTVLGHARHGSEGHAIGSLDGRAAALRGIVVPSGASGGPGHSIRITVVADEEFIARAGVGWRDAASDVVLSASGLMEQAGVGISVVDVERWDSDNETSTMTSLLDEGIRQAGRHSDSVLLFLTGQRTDKFDGWARPGAPAILLRAAVPHAGTLPSLAAHELGHILGLSHHEDGHDCPAGGCLMETKGFVHAWTWCDDHTEQITRILALI